MTTMEQFIQEAHLMPTADIMLILEDQMDLYTDEEIQVLKKELESRPSNAVQLESGAQEKLKEKLCREKKERLKLEKQAMERKKYERKIENLKQMGYHGRWKYKVISITDETNGSIDPSQISNTINDMALEGWRLKFVFTNELGKNTSPGMFSMKNATVEQNILIFERFVRF